jgi:hypothetical protein
VTQACAAVGIEVPSGAVDVAGLMYHWDVALWAGLIRVSGEQVHRPEFQDLASDPVAALDTWLRAVAGTFGLPDAPCPECLTTLLAMADADGAVAVADVVDFICAEFEEPLVPCPDCGEIHAMDLDEDDSDPGEHAVEALAKLTVFGAVRPAGDPDDDLARLTPLGRMLTDSISALFAPAPEDDAGAVVTRLGDLPLAAAAVFVQPWLAARTPVEAAGELFDVAETAHARWRPAAIDLASLIGPESLPAWRERATVPGYGAYIRAWLAEQGEPVPVYLRDEDWLTADWLSAVLSQATPGSAAVALVTAIEGGGDDLAEVVEALGECGHPDGPLLIELLREHLPNRAGRHARTGDTAAPLLRLVPADSRSYQLLITLRGIDDPPIWRRVAVAGSTTLNDLHYVIQDAMGWENDHMHIFRAGRRELAGGTSLREALPRRGSRIQYEYDFGDGWEHDIKSEGFFQNEQGVTFPACLDGVGVCPPEDCGGVGRYGYMRDVVLPDPDHDEHYDTLGWLDVDSAADFDPAAFSLDEANQRLAWLRPADGDGADGVGADGDEAGLDDGAGCGQAEIIVIRSQPRGKKPKRER